MEESPLRAKLIQAILEGIAPLDHVLACWEQGSTAMGRADQLSDIDLQVLVKDGTVEATKERIEQALSATQPLDLRWEVPLPTFHGHWQAFYRFQDVSPLLLIDLVIMEEKHPNRFLEPEIHGKPLIFLDKLGLIQQVRTDAAAFAEKLRKRLPLLEVPAEMFNAFVEKELKRGRPVDSLHFYQSAVLTRLVEALRMRYSPWRHNFGLRYLSYDLPEPVYQEVSALLFVSTPDEIPEKKARAMELLRTTLAELKSTDLEALLEATRS